MNDLKRYEFVISRRNPTHEEKRSVSSVDNLGIWKRKNDRSVAIKDPSIRVWPRSEESDIGLDCEREMGRCGDAPLYSKKLHIFVRLASTSCVTSLTILALAFRGIVVNHFCSLTLPFRYRCRFQNGFLRGLYVSSYLAETRGGCS